MKKAAGSRPDPFDVLGLSAADSLTDDDVRVAWRRIAAGTHPDRTDGGDRQRFALAAAAYTELRTAFTRDEARADRTHGKAGAPSQAGLLARIKAGHPVRLSLRLAVTIAVAVAGVFAAGPGTAAAPALVAGALTWFLVTARADVGPR
jgi:hypothetical protein